MSNTVNETGGTVESEATAAAAAALVKVQHVLNHAKTLGLHPETWSDLKKKQEKKGVFNITELSTSTVNEISLIQKEVYNRAIIHLCVSTVTSGTGAPTGVAVGQMSFARVDGTDMKQILKDILTNYGGCITKKAKSHRRGILILSKLRTAVSGIDMQRVDVKEKWSEVAQIVQEVLQEEQDIKVAMRSGKSTSDAMSKCSCNYHCVTIIVVIIVKIIFIRSFLF